MNIGIDGLTDTEMVGRGGSGVVYRAWEVAFSRTVAVKIVTHAADAEGRRRFAREQAAVGSLTDIDGVLTVFATGVTANGEPYLMMPYVGGGSLADRLATQGAMHWREAVELMITVAETMAEVHDAGVVHGDLKPHNVLVTSKGRPRLVDFGIARILDATVSAGDPSFTPAYAAPELLSDVHVATPATDIYGLGVTLDALIVGHAPFGDSRRDGLAAIIQRVISSEPALPSDGPDQLRQVLVRLMEKDPAHRPANMGAVVELLRSVLADDPTVTLERPDEPPRARGEGPPPGYPVADAAGAGSSSPGRRRGATIGLAASSIAALVGLGLWLALTRPGPFAPDLGDEVAWDVVSAGNGHTCAIDTRGRPWCWGANDFGELGTGTTRGATVPAEVATEREFVDISAGSNHTCAADDAGGVWCWGDGSSGQLGDGGGSPSVTPTLVEGLPEVHQSHSRRPLHVCAQR